VTEPLTPAQHQRRRPSAAVLSAVEIVVLAPLAALLAFWLIPKAFGIEWSCIGGAGVGNTAGESFAETLAVFGTIGWLVVLLGTLFANIAERERLAAVLPVAWFLILFAAMTIAAASVGPAPCPA
jgi:hypothetical protein